MRTIIEPFRIKLVEPLKMTTLAERDAILKTAHFNPFLIRAEDVLIDLLTDGGMSAFRGRHRTDDKTAPAGCLASVEAGDVPPGYFLIVESLDQLTS